MMLDASRVYGILARLESPPPFASESQLRLATAVTARMLSHLSTRLLRAPGFAA